MSVCKIHMMPKKDKLVLLLTILNKVKTALFKLYVFVMLTYTTFKDETAGEVSTIKH